MVTLEKVELEKQGFIQPRAVILGAFLSVVFSAINGYLSINMGWSFGYGAVAVMIGYTLFHRMMGGSCRRELSFLLIASVSSMAIYNTLSFILYMSETQPNVDFPGWFSPPREVILAKDLSLHYWIKPLSFLLFSSFTIMIAAVVISTVLRDALNRSDKMVWPTQAANTKLVDACMNGGGSAKLVAKAALIGFLFTLLQYIPAFWGMDLTMLDLSGLLPRGAFLVVSLSLAFASIGYLINLKTSLTLLGTGLFAYLAVSPALVRSGLMDYTPDVMAYYNDYLFKYLISPSIGVLLLGGILLSVVMLLKSKLTSKPEKDDGTMGYIELFAEMIRGLRSQPRLLAVLLGIFTLMCAGAWVLNPFSPLPRWFAVAFAFYSFFLAGFAEMVFVSKMQGETGMGMGFISMLLYDIPLFSAGYRGFTGYWTYSYLRANPWLPGGALPYYKYREETQVSWWDIILAKVVGWIPTSVFSIWLTLMLWKYVGFGTPMMPAVQLIQSKIYVEMLATGNITATIKPLLFIAGGVAGALLEVFTPISMMGIGMGMFLPPHYIIPLGVGGLARLYTDRKYGKEFYKEKGRLIVTGLMASSLLVQVFMTILTNFL